MTDDVYAGPLESVFDRSGERQPLRGQVIRESKSLERPLEECGSVPLIG